jgi:inosine-uridine nucleoside N-ribohydrolase
VQLPVILDCDPGHDDAIALVLAAHFLDLRGVTTVAGNSGLANTTRNALVVLDLAGRPDVAVHAGAAHPLVEPLHTAPDIHGASGLAGADLPSPSRAPTGDDAVGFLIDTTRAVEGLWWVVTGPMTNAALALRAAPDLAGRLGGISFMGGSATVGNRTAVAEFNVWADPEAASVVVGSGVPLVMSGLHLSHQLQATPGRVDAVRAVGTRAAGLFADLLTEFSHVYTTRYLGFEGAAVHDACAVLALSHPALFTRSTCSVAVELRGRHTRGMTVVDQRPFARATPLDVLDVAADAGAGRAEVLWTIDADRAFGAIIEAVGSAPA